MRTTNLLKTGLLLAALTTLFALVGRLLGGTGGMLLALGFAALTNAAAYWYSDRLALRMARARRLAPGEPLALASDLRRLERGTATRPMAVNLATAPLYIVHPFAAGGLTRLFSTHPPVAERVARLTTLAGRAPAPAFAG